MSLGYVLWYKIKQQIFSIKEKKIDKQENIEKGQMINYDDLDF